MSHHSMSRSQRAKGSKAKNIFQVTVLLAVVLWLLYQTKHSYDKKSEYAETEYSKLNKGDTNIKLGRKVNAGSENVISIESQGKNSDETSDTGESGEAGVDQDVFGDEEKAEEVRHESEESREDITDSGKEEALQEQENVDDNGGPHNVGKVNTEGIQEGLRLPSEKDGGSSDQNENQTEDVNSSEENGHLKGDATTADGSNITDEETIMSDEAMLSTTNQAENGDSTEQQSETGEAGSEHSDNAVPVAQEMSNSSVSGDRSNQDLPVDKDSHLETVEAQEGTGSDAEITSNNIVEEARTSARSDVESQAASASHEEIAGNSSAKAVGPDRSSDDGGDNFPKSVDENNVVLPDSNGAPGGEEAESQTDITEGQATGNYSIEAVTADTNSEGENANLPNASEENSMVMSDNNGVPKEEEFQLQMDHVLEGEKPDNNSEEAKAHKSDSEVSEKEANASDAEATTTITVETKNDLKLSDEAASLSLTSNNEHAELLANTKAQSRGNTGSDAENTSKSSLEDEKSDELPSQLRVMRQNNSDFPTRETPNEEVASHEDGALEVESASKSVEDVMGEVEPLSKEVMASELGNNTVLSSGNRAAKVQESSTGSESSEL